MKQTSTAAGSEARAVVVAAQEGSDGAIEELIGLCWGRAHRVAYLILQDRAEAEDVAQETMLALVDHLHALDPRRPPEPWVARVAANRAIDLVRVRRPTEELPAEPVAPGGPTSGGPVTAALAELPAEDRVLIVLRHLLGFRSAEIGDQLGITAGAARKRLKRSMDRLRSNLDMGGEER